VTVFDGSTTVLPHVPSILGVLPTERGTAKDAVAFAEKAIKCVPVGMTIGVDITHLAEDSPGVADPPVGLGAVAADPRPRRSVRRLRSGAPEDGR